MVEFSYSRLQLYATCPYRFYLKYILNKEDVVGAPAKLGTATHSAIQTILDLYQTEENINGYDCIEEAVLVGMMDIDFAVGVKKEQVEYLLKRAPIFNFSELKKKQVKAEIPFSLPFSPFDSDVRLRGFIDYYDGYKIIDWKTNRKTFNATSNYQLAIYAWAIMELYDLNLVTAELHFLRFGYSSKVVYTKSSVAVAISWAERLSYEINSILKQAIDFGLEAEEIGSCFPARQCADCSHCPFSIECFNVNN